MKKLSRIFFASTLLMSLSTLSLANPPPWAPAHGWRAKHPYYYYPSQQVYYSPEQARYFWLQGTSWQVGVKLPSWITLGQRVTVDLNTTTPYTQHAYIKGQYPPK